ncbi:MAG: VOC family protein [Dehalococcoidia bacterium]|nr:VOC family protein [Dehalococcoidia bacterium]
MPPVSVRYIVNDVDQAIEFYRDALGFTVDSHPAPGFASLSRGDLRLLFNRPGAGGAGQPSGGEAPAPVGWSRFQLEVADLAALVARLRAAGRHFRSDEIIVGNGGNQILLDDPSGNAIELFEPRAG